MSDEKKETYADISAELRDLSRSEKLSIGAKYCEPQPMVDGKPIGIYFAELADRIEAAIERDRTSRRSIKIPIEVVPELAGNAAAMREALVALRDAARNFYHQILNSKYNDIMDEYKCRERGFSALLDLRYAIPKANFALTEPPRNCDLPDPEDRFGKFCMSRSCESCPFQKSVCCRCKWLMAPESEVAE